MDWVERTRNEQDFSGWDGKHFFTTPISTDERVLHESHAAFLVTVGEFPTSLSHD
jgi:hypothetical protein